MWHDRQIRRIRCSLTWRRACLATCLANAILLVLTRLTIVCPAPGTDQSALRAKACLPVVYEDEFNDRSDLRCPSGAPAPWNASQPVVYGHQQNAWLPECRGPGSGGPKIPRIVHQFHPLEPVETNASIVECLGVRNPGWKVVAWSEASVYQLLADFFPDLEPGGPQANGRRSFTSLVNRVKFFVLYKFGGLYLSPEHRRPTIAPESLDPLLRSHYGIVASSAMRHRAGGTGASMLLFSPGHPFLLNLLAKQLRAGPPPPTVAEPDDDERLLAEALAEYATLPTGGDPSARVMAAPMAELQRRGETAAAATTAAGHRRDRVRCRHSGWQLMQMLRDRGTYKYLRAQCLGSCSAGEMTWEWLLP